MLCPKCGSDVLGGAVICPACDFVVDTSFLETGDDAGDDADDFDLDDKTTMFAAPPPTTPGVVDEAPLSISLPPFTQQALPAPQALEVASDVDDDDVLILDDGEDEDMLDLDGPAYGGEAVILGDVSVGDFESMLSDATSSFAIPDGVPRKLEPVPVYIAENVQQMVVPAAVLALKEGAQTSSLALSPLESHVLSFIDGERPVARIAKKAGLSKTDVKIAIGMLSDRKLLVVKGHLKPDALAMLDADDLDETGEIALPDRAPERPPEPPPEPVVEATFDLPLDALTPLDLPLDALIPLPLPEPEPESVSSFEAPVRPALNVRAATRATTSRAAVSAAAWPVAPTPPAVREVVAPAPAAKAAAPVTVAARMKAQQVVELALKDLREGKKARALTYVRMAADLDPENAKARDLLDHWNNAEHVAKSDSEDQRLVADAQRCEDLGQFDNALNIYKKVIALKPDEPELYNRLGILLALRLKDFTGATSALMKATELAPDNLAYRSNLGKIFKLSEGKADNVSFHAGSDSAALKDQVSAHREKSKVSFLDRLRGKK